MATVKPEVPIPAPALSARETHELKNLLTAILGNSELALMDLPVGTPAHYCLDQIQKAALRSVELLANPDRVAAAAQDTQQSRCILIIDDEDAVRDLASRLLQRSGFRVLHARTGEEGILRLRQFKDVVDAVIADISLPGMDGIETVSAVREISPRVLTVLWSGYALEDVRHRFAHLPGLIFLEKPAQLNGLNDILADLLKPPIAARAISE